MPIDFKKLEAKGLMVPKDHWIYREPPIVFFPSNLRRMNTRPPLLFSFQDCEELAAARRRELDIPRDVAAALGHSAVLIARQGWYTLPDGERVSIADAMRQALSSRASIPPDKELPPRAPAPRSRLQVEVSNETTLGAARRWVDEGLRPLALNFANGAHPGGGFLSGSRAQEEVLCRCSGLYLTLNGDPMYAAHLQRPEPDSTDWCILSPDVPVFRADDGELLKEPWTLSFVTCAAPYAPKVGQEWSAELLKHRIDRVLEIAALHGYRNLVLGAWGCGAFGNDPARTARDFHDALLNRFAGVFDRVQFAIADWSEERRVLRPFSDTFASWKC